MNLAIKVENISKLYRLGQVGSGTLQQDFKRWWWKTMGKGDPFAKVGEVNDRTSKGVSDYVWALKDVNFDVKQGEVLGIIGRNGAGKSTLLKILSKTTSPTSGTIKINGRIASLLEVGTGFHPELTGRENIFLNGAILGMTKREIRSKFDEIVDFSGVERYIDTPVKRYSSGMYVRLAFAVAAHLEPEILVIDEVLAVGDAEFQKKCLGKMKDVSVNDGRAVLFVSHNMAAVKSLCTRGILMKEGGVVKNGGISEVINYYLIHGGGNIASKEIIFPRDKNKNVQILNCTIYNSQRVKTTEISHLEDFYFEVNIVNNSQEESIRCNFSVYDQYETLLFISRNKIAKGVDTFRIKVAGNTLMPNSYKFLIALDQPNIKLYDKFNDFFSFEIMDIGHQNFVNGDTTNGFFIAPVTWN